MDRALFQVQDFVGYGFVAENSIGIFQQAVYGFLEGGGSLALVEALALRQCLLYAMEYLPFIGCILLDSLHVVQALHLFAFDFSELGVVLQDCKLLLDSRIDIFVCWVRRQATLAAHI